MNRFDALLVAQTHEQRPMTTHHTLEIDRPISLDRWARALEELVRCYPELGSRITAGPRPRRVIAQPSRAGLSRRLIHDTDSSHTAVERWIDEPIELERELPIRVRIAPGQVAEQAVTLSLHHSVTDGVGAMALFDRFTAIAAGIPIPARTTAPAIELEDAPAPERRALTQRLRKLRRPAARLIDAADPDQPGHRVAIREFSPTIWRRLGQLSRAAGVSRTTTLWHRVASTTARARLDDRKLPIRIVAGVDLRAYLGVPADALGNWLGTLEHDSPSSMTGEDPGALLRLHAALAAARRPDVALVTPSLLAALVRPLPRPLARAVFRGFDSETWPNPFTLMFAHIRPPARQCWPKSLRPRRLWCASTLPRKPGLGLTFTTVGDRVSVAATCRAGVLRRKTIEAFLDALVDRLYADVATAERLPGLGYEPV